MTTQIETLGELVAAIRAGEVGQVTAMVDNDVVSFHTAEHEVLSLHPYDVQMQALAVLGIEAEPV